MKNYLRMKIGIKLLPLTLKIVGVLIVLAFVMLIVIGMVQIITGENYTSDNGTSIDSNFVEGTLSVSSKVEGYRSLVEREAEVNGIGEYKNLILALMMQESGGNGNDPMQASESYCGGIGCINDPELSIIQGVKYFKATMEQANYDIKLGLQSYNFGSGFVSYVMSNGGKYTKELAISFSQDMYNKLKHTGLYRCHSPQAIANNACYGDIGYVDSVLKYLPVTMTDNGERSLEMGNLSSPLSTKLIKTSGFGWRIHPIFHTPKLHAGVDINCNTGETIHAVKEGTVVKSDTFGNVMLGEYVKIQHSPTDFTTYGHMSKRRITEGESVEAGQIIGECGSTGSSTAPHLHFEIHSSLWGGFVDPSPTLGI